MLKSSFLLNYVIYITSYTLIVYSAIASNKKSVQLICQYASGCKVDSDCVPGNKCTTEQLPYYSQCVPDSSKYSSNPTCLQNWGGRCSSNSDCCDPGSYCNNNWWYRQCQQPQFYASECLSQSSTIPTSALTAKPSFRPTLKPSSMTPVTMSDSSQNPASPTNIPICQYGGYCRSTYECALGNKCVIQSAYYSQCLPDPSQYSTTTTCVPTYNTKCSVSADCCDPGAICTRIGGCPYSTCVPMQSPMCTNPIGYAARVPSLPPVAIPTISPNFEPSIGPTAVPSLYPSLFPTDTPTAEPTLMPTTEPTMIPTAGPTLMPTVTHTEVPTAAPSTYYPCRNTTSCGTHSAILALPSNSGSNIILARKFERSTTITTVMIDASVVSIGISAFQYCTSLSSIIVPTTVTAIGSAAFQFCASLTSIILPTTVAALGSAIFNSCTSLSSIIVPTTVTAIGSAAFLSCTSLSSIIVPTMVTSIGSNCFQGCTSLRTIQLPTSLTNLPNSVFQLSGLMSIVIPTSVTTVGKVFFQVQNLSSLVIPTSITVIPNQFLTFNNALEQLTIPTTVRSIVGGAFISCTKLNCLIANFTNAVVASDAFVSTPLGGCPTTLPSVSPSTA